MFSMEVSGSNSGKFFDIFVLPCSDYSIRVFNPVIYSCLVVAL